MTTTAIALTITPKKGGLAIPSEVEPNLDSKPAEKRSQLEKAELTVYKPSTLATGDDLGPPKDRIIFQFNPKELTVAKTANWTVHPARGAQKAAPSEFTGAASSKLSLEMFLDASDSHERSVVAPIEKLFACCVPSEESAKQKKPLPPLVVFKWGQLRAFPAYITSVSAKFTLFAADGTPLRATATISMDEMPTVTAKQNPTSGTLVAQREHTVVAGDTLASLAYLEYGDPKLWRAVASHNNIDDPLRVHPGSTVLLPPPEELATLNLPGR